MFTGGRRKANTPSDKSPMNIKKQHIASTSLVSSPNFTTSLADFLNKSTTHYVAALLFLPLARIKASGWHRVTCSRSSCREPLVGTHSPERDLSFSFHPLIMPMRPIHVSERPLMRRLVMGSYCCIRTLPIRPRFKKEGMCHRQEACSNTLQRA